MPGAPTAARDPVRRGHYRRNGTQQGEAAALPRAADNAGYVNLRMTRPGREPPRMTPEDLVEIELIKRLKYRYARCLDLKLWDEIASCFTSDAVAAYSGGGYSFEGREAIIAFL